MHLATRLLLLAVIVLSTIGLAGCERPFQEPGERQDLPVEIRRLFLDTWTTLPADQMGEKFNPIELTGELDLDGDEDREWLYLYRYNVGSGSPIGGVIFDTQSSDQPTRLGTPYPPILSVIPYRLLPDLERGKAYGGYLGEASCRVRFYDTDKDGTADEVAILGYSNTLSHLAIFRWKDRTNGYTLVWHVQGNGGLELSPPPDPERRLQRGIISQVEVVERVNARFPLRLKEVWTRDSANSGYHRTAEFHLDFAFGMPSRPFYPEEAVLKYYLSKQTGEPADAESQVLREATGSVSAQAVQELKQGFNDPSVAPQGFATWIHLDDDVPRIYGGQPVTDATGQPYPRPTYADVKMNVVTGGKPLTLNWRVVNVAKKKPNEDPGWRVLGVQEVGK